MTCSYCGGAGDCSYCHQPSPVPVFPDSHDEHLGDGVYASFDGYHVNIAVNHHLNHAVALEPAVVRAFVDYARARGIKC